MKKQIPSYLRLALTLGASAVAASAASQSFDFADPKGVNNIQFQLDAPLESITGTATGIAGSVSYDPEAPEQTAGRITLATPSLTVGNPVMGEHLHGENWLHIAEYPSIEFELVSIENAREDGPRITATARGRLTIKGVTRDVTAPVSFTYLPGRLGARLGDDSIQGDLLVIRSNFAINRSDFGIMPGQNTDKVAETIHLALSIAGAARRS